MTYQLTQGNTILRLSDNAFIPPDPANTDYQTYLAWLEEGNTPDPAPPPAPPEPDWTAFNLAMIPPVGESDFEFWLDQFKILYQSSLATAAASGNAVETQRIYDLLKLQHPPTAEQVSAWQALADLHHIPLTF